MLLATVNEPITLSMLAADGRIDLYGQGRIYNSAGSLVTTVNLSHVAEGLYQVQYTPSTQGYFQVALQFYFDPARTIDAGYERQGETLDVNSFRTNILRILGLMHENSLIDQNTFDVNGNLLSARVRVYDTLANMTAAKAIAPAAYVTGQLFEYSVSASYNGTSLNKYSIARVM